MKKFMEGRLFTALFAMLACLVVYRLSTGNAPLRGEYVTQFIESDLAQVLQNGGKVIDRTSRVNLNLAFHTVRFMDEGWSAALLDRNIATLQELGWVLRAPKVLCKMGVQLTIGEGQSMYRGQGTNSLAFVYDSGSVKACAA